MVIKKESTFHGGWREFMKTKIFLLFLIFFPFLSIYADDFQNLSAIDLNKKGYELYLKESYINSLGYFKASFTKDPEYVYPHYNYACVLSILREQEVKIEGGSVDEITYHLITSMRLNKKYQTKWLSDPDLNWYREQIKNPTGNRPLGSLKYYDNNSSADDLLKYLKKENDWFLYHEEGIGYIYVRMAFRDNNFITAEYMDFNDSCSLDGAKPMNRHGSYQIFGNMIYVKFDPPFHIGDVGDPEFDTIKEMYFIYHSGNLYTTYCINWRLGIGSLPDFGDGA
jgi:hypothetical protein